MTNTPVVWDVIVMGINFSRTPALIFSNSGLCKENTAYLTDRLGGKEAWHPIHFSNARLFPMNVLAVQGRPFSLPSQRNFSISFKPKVAIAKFIGEMQKKVWYYEKWVGRHASFPPRRSVK